MKRVLLAATTAIFCSQGALAEVVNFNDVTTSFQNVGAFTSGSLTFAPTTGLQNYDALGVWTTAPNSGAYNGTPYLLDGYGDSFTLSETGGSVFTLDSVDLALGWNTAGLTGAYIAVTYDLASGGSSTAVYLLTDAFTTFAPDLAVTSVTVSTAGLLTGYLSLDNLVIETANSVTPVPEPTSMALMLAGLLAVGAVARRRGLGFQSFGIGRGRPS